MKKLLILLTAILLVEATAHSQVGIGMPLQRDEVYRVLNASFNKLLTGNPSAGEIANYASVDLSKALFSVKSTIPVHPGHKKTLKNMGIEERLTAQPPKISYLSFAASGNLLDQNYGVIFSNSSLNAGISLQAQYNFKVTAPNFSFKNAEWNEFRLKRSLLINTYHDALIDAENKMNRVALLQNRSLLKLKELSNGVKLKKNQSAIDLVKKTIDSLGLAISDRTGLADTLQLLVKENAGILAEITQTTYAIDSLDLATPAIEALLGLKKEALEKKLKNDYDTLASKLQLQVIRVTWFTVLGGYTRKSFNTFSASLSFENQFGKGKLDAHNVGIAINHLFQDRIKNRTWFLNGSISHARNNNLASLSTSSIEQVKKITNGAGDTVRTISNKINAYTSLVTNFSFFNLTGHLYYLFGKTPSGFHLLPSVDFQSNSLTVVNFTAGYIISFKNSPKDQTVINSELYVRFNDMTDANEKGNKFYKRNEIGISFTIPFSIF
jgi:hypothetical protein